MKYTDSKNNITFNNVKEAGVYHASGPIGLNGLYTTSGANIIDINSNLSLINAIDINWNGAQVEPGVVLNTTGDLLRWIKEHSGNSQGTNELTINNQGYWCINGVSTGVKAQGEDGLTPFIGSNGNWWIGTTDTGVSANAKTVAVSYQDSVGITVPGRYTIGTLQIGNNAPITLSGINTVGEGGSGGGVTPNISATASIDGGTGTPSVTVTKSGSNESPNFNFAFHNLKGEQGIPGSGSGGEGGTTYIENPYDDNQIRTDLQNIKTRLDNLHTWTQQEIQNLINGALDDWDWISELDPDTIFNLSGWDDKLKAYIQQVIKTDANGNGATWSEIEQKFNEIDATIQRIQEQIATGGEGVDYEYLASLIHLGIEDIDGLSTAIAKFETAYTEFQSIKGEVTTIKSDIAGLKTTANSQGAQLTAFAESMQNIQDQLGEISGTLSSQAALIVSTKTDLENRIAQAETTLASKASKEEVDTSIQTAISGLNLESYVDDKISTAKASLLTSTELTNKINSTVQSATSGFVTSTQVYTKGQTDGKIADAMSEMMSEIDGEYAKITTAVTKDSNGNIESDVKISADQIILEGTTFVDRLFSEGFNAKSGNYSTELSPGNIKLENENNTTLDLDTDSIILYQSNEAVFNLDTLQLSVDVPQTNISSENAIYLSSDYISVNDGLITVTREDVSVNGDLNIGDSKIDYYNNRLRIQSGVNIENDLILNKSLKLYNNLNEERASIELDNDGDLSFINKSGNNSMGVSFNTFETLYASTIECDEVVDGTSDERIKENIVPVETNISDIANARIVNFNFIGENKTKFGSIAQDWQNIFPEAVKENSKGNLTMNYGAIALGSAVTAAREIVALKEENRQLKDRLAAIEQKLEAINTALG